MCGQHITDDVARKIFSILETTYTHTKNTSAACLSHTTHMLKPVQSTQMSSDRERMRYEKSCDKLMRETVKWRKQQWLRGGRETTTSLTSKQATEPSFECT